MAEQCHLPALARRANVSLLLAEPNSNRLAAMAALFAADNTVLDYRELEGKVDGVIVATPPALHYPIAKWFLERGIHVLCEKPLTESIDEARDLVRIAALHGAHLAVNQSRRLYPTYQKIRELIQQGVLGPLKSITYHDGAEFSWLAATPHHFQFGAKGVWSDTGVHLLDAVCYWLGGKPTLVESLNDSFGGPEAMATVRLMHGDCGIEIKTSRLGRLINGFRIVGDKGWIESTAHALDSVTVQFADGTSRAHRCGSHRIEHDDLAQQLIDNFIQVVQGAAVPIVSGASTLDTIELLEGAYLQARRYAMPWNAHLGGVAADGGHKPRVLVTGAAGFLGGRVVESMLLTGTAVPLATIRSWPRASRIARHEVDVALCDILNNKQVESVVAGVDSIVHCAVGDDRQSIVGGTRNLLEAAERHGIKRFVFISTAEVYGPEQAGDIDETAPTPRTGSVYGDSKIEAEELCRDFSRRGVATVILRPSIIYGPFSRSWSMDMATRLLSGKWGVFNEYGDGRANLVYVDDLVQAIFLALVKPEAGGETYNVNGSDRVTWNEYFARFNTALGLPPLKPISSAKSRLRTMVMDQVGRATAFAKTRWHDKLMEIYLREGVASKWMKRLKGSLKSTPSTGELTGLYSRQASYNDSKIQQLGYAPDFDLQSGLANTVHWLRLHEIIPGQDGEVDVDTQTVGHDQGHDRRLALT